MAITESERTRQSTEVHSSARGQELYINRELSWLEFNQRVLDQATSSAHPLLERVKFLSIVGSNLDEFFMIRVATLLKMRRAGFEHPSDDGLTPSQQLIAIRERAARMMRDQAACWEMLRPELAANGILFVEPEEYTAAQRRHLAAYFQSEIFPLLTPLAFDPGHPFPLISNRSKNFAVAVRQHRRTKFARVKVPPSLPRFVPVVAGGRVETFAFVEDVIRENLGALFPGLEVAGAHLFRVIRDTDMTIREDAAGDLLQWVDRSLKQMRGAAPSLLQVDAAMPRRVLNILVENFEIENDIVVRSADRLDFADWMQLHRLPRPELKDPPFAPQVLWEKRPDYHPCVFDDIREQDRSVHHPFDSFSAVEAFLAEAATDPHVAGIKMTLYRIGRNSPIVDLLIAAAEAGKQVAVLVELKARFDERNNIEWATRLEDAGIHVVYGVENLKTHCKLCLVVRREADGVRRYAHIGTGNYNRLTAQVYTDFGLFTADPMVLDDISDVFNYLTGYSQRRDYRQMLVAPVSLRARFLGLIEREIAHAHDGRAAHIIIKNNAITDAAVVRALYRASRAGVEIDGIVRGICCLRPGVPELSDRIRIRSIVGRFLEHSRAYWFANGGEEELYMGSADLMERNLDRRVETLVLVRDSTIVRHVRDVVMAAYLADTERAYVLNDRTYERVEAAPDAPRMSAQEHLIEVYTAPDDQETD